MNWGCSLNLNLVSEQWVSNFKMTPAHFICWIQNVKSRKKWNLVFREKTSADQRGSTIKCPTVKQDLEDYSSGHPPRLHGDDLPPPGLWPTRQGPAVSAPADCPRPAVIKMSPTVLILTSRTLPFSITPPPPPLSTRCIQATWDFSVSTEVLVRDSSSESATIWQQMLLRGLFLRCSTSTLKLSGSHSDLIVVATTGQEVFQGVFVCLFLIITVNGEQHVSHNHSLSLLLL